MRAHPPSRRYRALKFVQRHRGAVAATMAFALALVASLGIALWQARVARQESERAQAQASRADSVRGFLESLFEPVDRGMPQAQQPTVAALVATGVERLRAEPRMAPGERVDLLMMFARLNDRIGEPRVARALGVEAAELAQSALPAAHSARTDSLALRGAQSVRAGDYDAGEADLREAQAQLVQAGRSGAPLIAVLDSLAVARMDRNDHEQALALERAALAERIRTYGEAAPELAAGYNNLGYGLVGAGRFDEAADAYQRSYELDQKYRDPGTEGALGTLSNWGWALARAGRIAPARELLAQADEGFAQLGGQVRFLQVLNSQKRCRLDAAFGTPVEAGAACERMLAATRAYTGGSGMFWGYALQLEAAHRIETGELAQAQAQVAAALEQHPESPEHARGRGGALQLRATLAWLDGDAVATRRDAQAAAALFADIGDADDRAAGAAGPGTARVRGACGRGLRVRNWPRSSPPAWPRKPATTTPACSVRACGGPRAGARVRATPTRCQPSTPRSPAPRGNWIPSTRCLPRLPCGERWPWRKAAIARRPPSPWPTPFRQPPRPAAPRIRGCWTRRPRSSARRAVPPERSARREPRRSFPGRRSSVLPFLARVRGSRDGCRSCFPDRAGLGAGQRRARALGARRHLHRRGSGCTHGTIQAAINAAAGNPGIDTIRVSRSLAYTEQALVVNTAESLEIAGGYATCAQAVPDDTLTVIDGGGAGAAPVLRLTTTGVASVRLSRLRLVGGDVAGDGEGGGIRYTGSLTSVLELERCEVIGNSAAYGGGIYAVGNGSRGRLVLRFGNLVSGNTARVSGGGIYVENANLDHERAREPGCVQQCRGLRRRHPRARPLLVTLRSGGRGNLGTIYANTAGYGGGIALQGSQTTTGDAASWSPDRGRRGAGAPDRQHRQRARRRALRARRL